MNRYIIGTILLVVAVGIALGAAYKSSQKSQEQLVFSGNAMVDAIWNRYKQNYIESGSGRTLDKQRDNITTSEGQSYTMLRAVWLDDKPTFDASWKWTKDNLDRPNDNLFSWLYGEKPDGSYGILTDEGGNNTASDADTDIAMALIFASNRWGDESYLNDARGIIDDVWKHDVILVNDKPYLTASSSEATSTIETAVINPSYLAPYAYRMFERINPDNNWEGLVDTSYEILEASAESNLDKSTTAGLPPDWVYINKATGQLVPATAPNLSSKFSYDALRIPWRLSLDWQWYKETRAKDVLAKFSFLEKEWVANSKINAEYSHDGEVVGNYESPAMYGGIIGYFLITNPSLGETVYNTKLKVIYNPDTQSWKETLGYYEDNWAWFGIALVERKLPNLYPNPTAINR
jgi:endoglucanase